MERGKLYFTIGLPRSGKSTFCDRWVRGPFEVNDEGSWPDNVAFNYLRDEICVCRPRVIVSGDDFRKALHSHSYISEAEGFVFSMMDAATRALLSRGFDVIVDETCTTEETLKRYLRIDINAEPVWINTPVDVCKERAIATGKEFLLRPIDRIAKQFDHLKANWVEIFWDCREEVKLRQELDNVCV